MGGAAPAELLDVARTVAVEAADLVRRRRVGEVLVAAAKSSPVDVVTAVDQESESLLRRRIAQLRPDDGFLGEEGGRFPGGSGTTWVVDPIDGTVNYLYGLPHYAVSVAAVDEHDRALAGVVVDVPRNVVYAAARGLGATSDGVPLRVRPVPPMAERLVLTGFSYAEEVRRLQGAAVARLLGRVRDIRRMGSAALELCAVAAGQADAYVEEGLHLWDRAAAALIAEEAGAVTEVHLGVSGLECTVCAPAASHREMVDLFGDCGFLGPGAPPLPDRPLVIPGRNGPRHGD